MTLQAPTLISSPSPNRNGYSGRRRVDALVWHISGGSDQSGISWLTNPASGVSCNYFNTRPGVVHEIVPFTQDAWVNGIADHEDRSEPLIAQWDAEGVNFNQRTIGIENGGMSSNNKGGSLDPRQIDSLIYLSAWLCQQAGIVPSQQTILGHYEIDAINRPYCPGFSSAEWKDWVDQVVVTWKRGQASVVAPPSSPAKAIVGGVDRNAILLAEAARLAQANPRAIGTVLWAATVDLTGLRSDLPNPKDTQTLVTEKTVLWYDARLGAVDFFHRGQYEALLTQGKAQEWK